MTLSLFDIILRSFIIIICAGLIGLEREHIHKPAGLRTNILVGLGSGLMMMMLALLFGDDSSAQSRIAGQVITGIGFLGAGAIFQARGSVVGLTTAATIWVVAAIGLAIGAGYFSAAITATVITFVILYFFGRAEHHSPPNQE